MASSSGASSGGGFPRRMAQRGVSYVQASQGRQTAVILIVAILLARLVLTKQLQTFWGQVWQPMKPLGAGLPGKASQPTTSSKKAS